MFKTKENYRNYLHQILQSYSDGLSLAEISDVLKITDNVCEKLIAEEEKRGTLAVNFDKDSTPLYISKRKISASQSLEKNSWFKYLVVLVIALIVLFLFLLNGIFHQASENLAPQSKIDLPTYVNAKIAAKKIAKYKSDRTDLENRLGIMESQRMKCYDDWLESKSCYITNRLLSEAEFERELAEINLEISKLNELISLYNS